MRIVVNHLTFREPIGPQMLAAAAEGDRVLHEAGGLGFHFVLVDDLHAMIVLLFADRETEERVARDAGGPWMREHVLRLLDGEPTRVSGEVVPARPS